MELSHETTEVYPLWMVPVTLEGEGELTKEKGCTMFVDLGIYGISEKSNFAGRVKTLRKFEKFTLERGGFQALYAETLMNYEEFRQMFQQHDHYYQKVVDTLKLFLAGRYSLDNVFYVRPAVKFLCVKRHSQRFSTR